MPSGERISQSLICLLTTVFLWENSVAEAEVPQPSGMFPAGVQQGQTVTVTLIGKPGSEPLETWCSRDDVVLSQTNKPAEWTLTAAASAPPGLGWVRFYNAEGASRRLPVVVGLLPEITETEPNDTIGAAHPISSLPATVNGQLNGSGKVDTFAVDLEVGQTLVASVDAHRLLGSPMDPVLQLLSPRGFVVEQNDDHHGNDPRIVFTAAQSGTHLLRMFAFPAKPNTTIGFSGADTYVYRLTLTTGPFVDHVQPLALSRQAPAVPKARGWNLPDGAERLLTVRNDRHPPLRLSAPTNLVVERFQFVDYPALLEETLAAETEPTPLSVPVSVTGVIAEPEQTDVFHVTGRKGQSVAISVEARPFDSPLDPLLKLFDPDGKLLKEADDVSREINDARLSLKLPADGTYRIEVRDRFGHGDEWSAYLLSVVEDRPRYELTLADDPLTLEAGKSLDVAVAVNRLGGFDEEITLRMLGTPPGIQVAEVTSPPSGDTSKKVTLKLVASADVLFSGPLRVIGTIEQGEAVLATTAAPAAGLRMGSIWLTVTAAKQ